MIEQKYCPAVSVIIPMYNAEKYIGECLDSLLNQTFQAFEVIVVDDCSTDNGFEIVKAYAPKFGGRLTLTKLVKNSGSGALPRNKGMNFSRGEYIQFLDADDTLTPTALEEMYSLAKEYDADVVYCEKHYTSSGVGEEYVRNIRLADKNIQEPPFVDKPTFETENMAERVMGILNGRFWVVPWDKFVRRDLIFEHEIFFPHVKISEDDIWTLGLIFYAKKFLRVPNMIYVQRVSESSMIGVKRSPQQTINFWLNPVLFGLKSLDDLMSRHEFFEQSPKYRYATLEHFIFGRYDCFLRASLELSPFEVYDAIKQKFGDKLGDNDVLICALCAALNNLERITDMERKELNDIIKQTQQRVVDLEKINREQEAYISELERFIMALNRKDG